MESKNIWKSYNFNEVRRKSILDYLYDISKGLDVKTSNILLADISAFNGANGTQYNFYINAPKLGNYRIKIFSVIENDKLLAFPVDIFDSEDQILFSNISEDDFVNTCEKIILFPLVKKKIENLYRMSIVNNK